MPDHPATADSHGPASPTTPDRVASLRGAGVPEVDPRRLGILAVSLCAASLAALSAALFVAGAHKNAQISALRDRGVPVTVTVTGCLGELGGSGSNPAGFACTGTYTVGGHRYTEHVPGSQLRPPGSTVAAVTDSADPRLVDTAADVAAERPSFGVYVVPTVLAAALVVFAATVGTVSRRRRRRSAGTGESGSLGG